MSEVSEGALEGGEQPTLSHDHAGVAATEEALAAHVSGVHGVVVPDGLSYGAVRGMHDRFHGEAHAADD